MGLKSSIKKVGSSLKKTFMPSKQEAASRRLKVFKSESKGKAAAVIGATAASLIAAPVVAKFAASKLGKTAIGKKAISTVKAKLPIGAKTKGITTQTQMGDTSTAPIGKPKRDIFSSITKQTRARGTMARTRKKSLAWYKRQTALLKAKKEYSKARGF